MRHVILLYNYYKSYQNFFTKCNIVVGESEIEEIYKEFASSKSLSKFSKNSEKFFDYLINRLHMLLRFNMFEYTVPLVYKKYTCIYSYDLKLDMFTGYVQNEHDSDVDGKSLRELNDNFMNTVDYVILMR